RRSSGSRASSAATRTGSDASTPTSSGSFGAASGLRAPPRTSRRTPAWTSTTGRRITCSARRRRWPNASGRGSTPSTPASITSCSTRSLGTRGSSSCWPARSCLRYVGRAVRRVEDPRLLTGAGGYLDDLRLPDLCALAFVRSPHAHARIERIDAREALALPGVAAVVTGAELRERVRPLAPRLETPGFRPTEWPALADGLAGKAHPAVGGGGRLDLRHLLARVRGGQEVLAPLLHPL